MDAIRTSAFAALLATVALATPAQSAVFDLFWTGDPNVDSNIQATTDPTLTAIGFLTINKMAGESFGAGDATGSVTVVSNQIGDVSNYVVTTIAALAGMVSADGLTATLTNFFMTGAGTSFGCVSSTNDCGLTGGLTFNIMADDSVADEGVTYFTAAGAQASFRLTVEPDDASPAPVPLPAAMPLLLAGLGAIGTLRRRR